MTTNILVEATTGKILAIGPAVRGTVYTGKIPSDFLNTFAFGKYKMVSGVITAVPGWVMPPPPVKPVKPTKP